MRDIAENTVIQIEVTNACELSCQGCTRHVGHHKSPFFMGIADIRNAILSLRDFSGRIGCMGGSPTLHPRFAEIALLFQELIPIERRELWVTGFRWGKYKDLIKETWLPHLIHYNDHISYDGMHKPLMVAIDEVVDDEELRAQLIDNCSYQSHWSASITPRGAYFCEIAASLDALFDGPGGWPVVPGWWERKVADYEDQIAFACGKCSGAIPMPARSDNRGGRDAPSVDLVTPGNLARLRGVSRKIDAGQYEIYNGKMTREDILKYESLNPRAYRSFEAHKPEDVPTCDVSSPVLEAS